MNASVRGRWPIRLAALGLTLGWLGFTYAAEVTDPAGKYGVDWGDPRGEECVDCHMTESPGLYMEWNKGKHGQSGVNCLDCHKAQEGDPDAFMHEKALISIVVTPKDCARCHQKEYEQMEGSHHAKAGQILESLDNLLGELVGGPEAVNAGCKQCHGGVMEFQKEGRHKGRPIPGTWPNTGIGRINPDGSLGSCSACHGRHRFSRAQARTPETCGKCHVGPDHPQIEVYNESKHGIIYHAKTDEMNLDSSKWVAGIDYSAAPTCATCHMSAGPEAPKTHDVGERLSWTLRPPISTKINLVRLENGQKYDVPEGGRLPKVGDSAHGAKVVEVLTWQDRRERMQKVCFGCHSTSVIEGHYIQFDDLVNLYNEKFAKPISAAMDELRDKGYLTQAPFDEKIEWTWWEIWHHEGRRARHGASMSGPDYTWWNGMYEVGKNTYFEWIPQLRETVRKKDGNEQFADTLLQKYFKPIPGHDWYFNGMSADSLEKVRADFEERYGKGAMR